MTLLTRSQPVDATIGARSVGPVSYHENETQQPVRNHRKQSPVFLFFFLHLSSFGLTIDEKAALVCVFTCDMWQWRVMVCCVRHGSRRELREAEDGRRGLKGGTMTEYSLFRSPYIFPFFFLPCSSQCFGLETKALAMQEVWMCKRKEVECSTDVYRGHREAERDRERQRESKVTVR